jgi:hypothetical protein
MEKRSLLIPIYNQTITMVYGSYNDFSGFIKDKYRYEVKISPFTEGYSLELIAGGARNLFLFFNKSQILSNDIQKFVRVMSHELVHLLDYILEYAGIKSDPNNNEPRAYLSGFLARLIYNEMTAIMNTGK